MNKDNRRNFTLRLQPSDGTLLAEVIDWLKSMSLRERRKKVEEAFIILMLPYARKARFDKGAEEIEGCYWSTHEQIIQYLYVMQQTLGVKPIQPIHSIPSMLTGKREMPMNNEVELEEFEEEEEEFENFRSTNSLLGIEM